jgi:septin family protein
MRLADVKIRRKKNVKKGIQFCLMVCGASGTGMLAIHSMPEAELTTFQAVPHLSTLSVARESFSPKKLTTQPMLISRKASESSP